MEAAQLLYSCYSLFIMFIFKIPHCCWCKPYLGGSYKSFKSIKSIGKLHCNDCISLPSSMYKQKYIFFLTCDWLFFAKYVCTTFPWKVNSLCTFSVSTLMVCIFGEGNCFNKNKKSYYFLMRGSLKHALKCISTFAVKFEKTPLCYVSPFTQHT